MLISSLDDLSQFAQRCIDQWYHKFLLQGELGVGKTQFTKEIVALLGGDKKTVQSPTYTYMNQYELWDHTTLLHMDLYRLSLAEEAFQKWIFEAIEDYEYICIEWPQRESRYIDETRVRLQFSFTADGKRIIEIWKH